MTNEQQAFSLRTAYLVFTYFLINPGAQEMVRDYYYLKFGVNLKQCPEILKAHVREMNVSHLKGIFKEHARAALEAIHAGVNK